MRKKKLVAQLKERELRRDVGIKKDKALKEALTRIRRRGVWVSVEDAAQLPGGREGT